MGFEGRMPRLVASGGRGAAYGDFRAALQAAGGDGWIGLWIDSEDPMSHPEAAWAHLAACGGWEQPKDACDDNVLLMVTCMETWLIADRASLTEHYGAKLGVSALPPVQALESRDRHAVQDALAKATALCTNSYEKGKRSFALLARIEPSAVEKHCPSLTRCRRILNERL
jgi:hypothetical protein